MAFDWISIGSHLTIGTGDPSYRKAVSGLLYCKEECLLGLRGKKVAQSGKWELVPSGHLEGDPNEDILRELQEEAGIEREEVSIYPIGLALDQREQIYEYCYALELKKKREVFLQKNLEYEEFKWVKMEELHLWKANLLELSTEIYRVFSSNKLK